MTRILHTIIAAATLLAGLALPPAAAEEPPAGLDACRSIDDDGARLACYDRLAGRAASDAAAGVPQALPPLRTRPAAPPPAADAAPPASTRPAAPPPAEREEDQQQNFRATVVEVQQKPRGERVITLDNGETWEEIEPSRYFPVEPGDKVEVRTGFFGSHRMVTPAGGSSRVRRAR